jgi:hypothetical protein
MRRFIFAAVRRLRSRRSWRRISCTCSCFLLRACASVEAFKLASSRSIADCILLMSSSNSRIAVRESTVRTSLFDA